MKDILSEIIANKRFEVDLQKQAISIEQLQEGISESPTPRSMKQALASSASGIIAEFKRRSPSKGWIKEEVCPKEIVPSYAAAGASALSILTDEKFFGGSLKDIRTARPLVEIPYFLLQPHLNRTNAMSLQKKPTRWVWRSYWKFTTLKNYHISIRK